MIANNGTVDAPRASPQRGEGVLCVRRVPIASLHNDPANARRHDQKNLDAIAASLAEFGQVEPLVVQKGTGRVIGGNGRLEVMRKSGKQEVDIVEVDVDSTGATALGIALNRTAELATWDQETLASLLDTLPKDTLPATGYGEDDLKALLDDLRPPVVEDEAPEPLPDAVSRVGDLWEMGTHRLLCGDSTKSETWAALEVPERFVCFTSPPYNLGESMKLRGETALAQTGNAYVGHDDRVPEYAAFIQSMATHALASCEVVVFNVQPVAGCKAELLRWMGNNAESVCDVVTWDKGHAPPQMAEGVLASRYEWLVILTRQRPASRRVPLSSWRGTLSALYAGPPQRSNEHASIHGATFPVHLPLFVVGDLCNRSAGCVDCCAGTGTTLVACEQLGRRCYAIEIEPRYVDVAVRRWQKLTGKAATLNGRTFADVASDRGVSIE